MIRGRRTRTRTRTWTRINKKIDDLSGGMTDWRDWPAIGLAKCIKIQSTESQSEKREVWRPRFRVLDFFPLADCA